MTNFTPQQLSVISHIATSTNSLCVIARAGSGKTTTIVEGISQIPPSKSILIVAFNKSVQLELESKIRHPNSSTRTLNALGWSVLKREYRQAILQADKTTKLIEKYLRGIGMKDGELYDTRNMYDTAITKIKLMAIDLPNLSYDICQDVLEANDDLIEASEHQITTLHKLFTQDYNLSRVGTFNFDDQVYYPLVANFKFPQADVLIVDEAQDLNPLQHQCLLRCLNPNSKIVFVGDPAQSIYGFRGALPESMHALTKHLAADTLNLTVSFRCSREIISYAQTIVPDIEPCAGAGQGKITFFKTIPHQLISQSSGKSAVLCRNNAPLYGLALELIRQNIRCHVKGKSLKPYINSILKQIAKGYAKNYGWDRVEFHNALSEYFAKEKELTPPCKRKRLASLEDKIETLRYLSEEISYGNTTFTTSQILDKIDEITVQGNGIPLSTGHQAKGLEWDTVWFLAPELIPSQYASSDEDLTQENNLKYVIITRAKYELNLITNQSKKGNKDEPNI